ncbi:MAG: ABC transporter ATP-binding protein [Proteobacteria bacterium]|nr:ABC transporter ATP-binding protein [Pseudomonadota bacterium]
MSTLLDVRNLGVRFHTQSGAIDAVSDVSFKISAGSTLAIVGESGSGKSVTAQAIMGLLPRVAEITAGEILFADPAEKGKVMNIAALDPESSDMQQIRGGQISIIFQEPMTSLSPLHTIGDQISETLLLHQNTSKQEAKALSIDMLERVGFPEPARSFDSYPFELSGGLRQRAMISMALVCRPALLIADEPSTALDVTIQAQILKLIKDLQQDLKMAVLLITHDLGVVANMADEVVVIYHGRVMESGSTRDIFANPEHPYLKALLKAIPHFNMKEGERLVPLREIDHQAGNLLRNTDAADQVDDDVPILSVRNISKSYLNRSDKSLLGSSETLGPIRAVDDVSFEIRRGECLGLVGESGCGKTTLSKIIMRSVDPDNGEIIFNDRGNNTDLLDLGDQEMIPFRQKIQYIFQDPFGSLNPRMTVHELLSEPLIIHRIGDANYRSEFVQELMNLVGLNPRWLNRYPHSFSGGQRQRVGIARSLALKPRLVICDEPVSALDVSVQAQILNLLKDLQEELGLTYLFISHNLAVVDYIAERIAVMCAGRLVEVARREDLFRNPLHPYTRALVSAIPYADPDHPLDFDALMEGQASIPEHWPDPFAPRGDIAAPLLDTGSGHLIRAFDLPSSNEVIA